MSTMINRGKELIRISQYFFVSTEDLHVLVSGAENVIALVGIGKGANRISNAIKDAILHSRNIAKEYNIFTANKVLVKLLYPKNNPIKVCKTICILSLYELFFGDADGEYFDKIYEEEADDVAHSDVIADTRVFSEMRFGDANSWALKCSASEKESGDSEITALILASNLKPF